MNTGIENLIYTDVDDIETKVNSPDYSLLSVQRRLNIYRFLSLVLANRIEGDVIELGVYTGMTAVLLREILNEFDGQDKTLHLYDSFEGLPEANHALEKNRKGVFADHPMGDIEEIVLSNFRTRDLQAPNIHRGWFDADVLDQQLPDRICFAHLDGDMYESIKVSLEAVYPKLAKGGVMIVDDYGHPAWRGVQLAVQEFNNKRDLVFYDLNTQAKIDDHQGIFIKSGT